MGHSRTKWLGFLLFLASTEAQAKLTSATSPPVDESTKVAVHRPTGCMAKVVFNNDAFVKAQIIDPACLPKGVTARDIPGTSFDFLVTPN